MALAPLDFAARGLTGERDPKHVVSGDLSRAENVDFTNGTLLQKEPGSAKINATPIAGSPAILEGTDWWANDSTQRRVIATSDGNLYKDAMAGTFSTTLKTGLATNRVTQMVEGGQESTGRSRKLFIVNGANVPQVLAADGATTTNLATPPADWTGGAQPSFMFPFRNSMVGGGNNNDPHRIYGSLTTNHEDFVASGVWNLSIYPGEGQRLVAGTTAFGKGWLWKFPRGIYFIDDAASSAASWLAKPVSHAWGAAPTPHSLAIVDDSTVAFLSNTGSLVFMQESGGTLTGVEFMDMSKALKLRSFLRDSFNLGRLDKTQLMWYDEKKQLHVIYSNLGGVVENRRLIVDFNEERTRIHVSTKDNNSCLWLEQDVDSIPRPVYGDNAGTAWKLDQVNRTVGGAAYPMRIETVATDLSDIDPGYAVKKLFYRLHLEYEATGNYDVNVSIYVDNKLIGTVPFNQGQPSTTLPFTLPTTLGGRRIERRSRDIAGEGYYISLRVLDTSANNPRIARAWIEFEPLVMAR